MAFADVFVFVAIVSGVDLLNLTVLMMFECPFVYMLLMLLYEWLPLLYALIS